MGRSDQRHLAGILACWLCFLVLPYRTQRGRREMGCGLQLGYYYFLRYLRVGWHLLRVWWRREIYRASVSGEGGMKRRTRHTAGGRGWRVPELWWINAGLLASGVHIP